MQLVFFFFFPVHTVQLMGSFVPQPGLEPGLAVKAQSPQHRPPGNALIAVLICISRLRNLEYLMHRLPIYINFLGEMFIRILCPFFDWVVYVFIIKLKEFLYILVKSFIRSMTSKYLLLFSGLCFCFLNGVF